MMNVDVYVPQDTTYASMNVVVVVIDVSSFLLSSSTSLVLLRVEVANLVDRIVCVFVSE